MQATITAKNKLEVVFAAWELEVICRRAHLAGVTVQHVFAELVEPVLNAERVAVAKVPKEFLVLAPRGEVTTTRTDLEHHRTKLEDGMAQRIIHLLVDENLTTEVVAQRCNVGQTTIRRIKAAYDASAHVRVPSTPSCRAAHIDGGSIVTASFPKIESRRSNGNGAA